MNTDCSYIKTRSVTPAEEYDPQYVRRMCVILFVLIVGRSVNNFFFYVFAAASCLIFYMSSPKHCIPMLLFLLPFSTITKHYADSYSMFTILTFLVVLKQVLSNFQLDNGFLKSLFLFICYNLFFSGTGQVATVVSLAAGMLMLYYTKEEKIDLESAVIAFSLGICLSSLLGLLKSYLPIVNTLVRDSMIKLQEGNYAMRFSGLQGNPNYYTLDISIALSAIVVLMYQKKQQPIYIGLMIMLSLLGLMSLSKSFIFAWALLMVCWFVLSCKQGAGKVAKYILFSIVGVAIASYFFRDYINDFLIRLEQDASGSMNSITTGRSNLWGKYFNVIFSDAKILIFGNGLKTILGAAGKGTHNTYLEAIFSMGIVGLIIFMVSLKKSLGKIDLKSIIIIPIFILLFRMFAITILTYDNLWFYILLILLLSKGSRKPIAGKTTKYRSKYEI